MAGRRDRQRGSVAAQGNQCVATGDAYVADVHLSEHLSVTLCTQRTLCGCLVTNDHTSCNSRQPGRVDLDMVGMQMVQALVPSLVGVAASFSLLGFEVALSLVCQSAAYTACCEYGL